MKRQPIASLRRRLTIEAPTPIADGGGGTTLSWSTFGLAWALIEARGGRETRSRDQHATDLALRIVVRWRPGLTPAMRLRDGDRVYAIRAIADPDGRRRRLEIDAVEERL